MRMLLESKKHLVETERERPLSEVAPIQPGIAGGAKILCFVCLHIDMLKTSTGFARSRALSKTCVVVGQKKSIKICFACVQNWEDQRKISVDWMHMVSRRRGGKSEPQPANN